jgi:hypothetical protein
MFKEYPVFGVGKAHYQDYSRLIAHNTYIQNMAETGFVGFYIWTGMVYVAFKGLRLIRLHEDEVGTALARLTGAVEISLVGYLSASMFITTDFDLLYLLLGMAFATLAIARMETEEELVLEFGWTDYRNIGWITVGLVVVMYAATRGLSG